MQRQTGDGLRQDADAAVYRCHGHSRPFIDIRPGSGLTEEESRAGARQVIAATRPEDILKNAHPLSFLLRTSELLVQPIWAKR